MKIKALILALTLALSSMLVEAGRNPAIARAHKTTHSIAFETILDGSTCSATAIGPHALLTASHCELGADNLDIDGENSKIYGIFRDQLDHSILLVSETFKNFATISQASAEVGDEIFFFGNPKDEHDVFRKGNISRVAPKLKEVNPAIFMFISPKEVLSNIYDINAYFGDSGAGIFNEDGELIGVLSAIKSLKEDNADVKDVAPLKLNAGFNFNFEKKDLDSAIAFQPPIEKKSPTP